MALTTGTALALALAAASAGTQYYNTQKTAKRTDNALATQIRNQGNVQKKADARVNEEVADLEKSRAEEHRVEALDSYMNTLRTGRDKAAVGSDDIGSSVFQKDAAQATQDVQAQAGARAGLMARADAPGMQRQQEAFGYGRLGTDLGLLSRESFGQNYLDQLRVRKASERNAGLDALSAILGGAAGAAGSGATAAAGSKAATGLAQQFFANGGIGGLGY